MDLNQEKAVSDGLEKKASSDSHEMKEDTSSVETSKDKVSYESHKKLLGQLKKAKEGRDELQARLEAIENESKIKEEESLKKKGEWQKLFEQRESKIKSLEEEIESTKRLLNNSQSTLLDSVKLHQFLEKLPGKIKHKDYLCHVNLDDIVINPDTGDVDNESIDQVVNKFMGVHANLVDTSHVGKIPHGHPKSTTQLSHDQWKNMSLAEMKKPENFKQAMRSFTSNK